jgi:hypothetical protein
MIHEHIKKTQKKVMLNIANIWWVFGSYEGYFNI